MKCPHNLYLKKEKGWSFKINFPSVPHFHQTIKDLFCKWNTIVKYFRWVIAPEPNEAYRKMLNEAYTCLWNLQIKLIFFFFFWFFFFRNKKMTIFFIPDISTLFQELLPLNWYKYLWEIYIILWTDFFKYEKHLI